jgi:hypothetical protein
MVGSLMLGMSVIVFNLTRTNRTIEGDYDVLTMGKNVRGSRVTQKSVSSSLAAHRGVTCCQSCWRSSSSGLPYISTPQIP